MNEQIKTSHISLSIPLHTHSPRILINQEGRHYISSLTEYYEGGIHDDRHAIISSYTQNFIKKAQIYQTENCAYSSSGRRWKSFSLPRCFSFSQLLSLSYKEKSIYVFRGQMYQAIGCFCRSPPAKVLMFYFISAGTFH